MIAAIGVVVAWVVPHGAVARPDAHANHARGPTVVTTPWPVELPCTQPRTLWASTSWGTALAWSSDDNGETRSFTLSSEERTARLPRSFEAARFTRLISRAPDGDPSGGHFSVHCANGGDLTWGPCPDGTCAVRVTYPGEALPISRQRTRHWTDEIRGSPWAEVAPDVHWTRFHRDIARKPTGNPAAVREALRFSRAYASELRDLLAGACRTRRCSGLARDARAKVAAYLGDRSPNYSNPSARSLDEWSYEWAWTATAGSVPLAISCVDMEESRDLLCQLSVGLVGGVRLVYSTFQRQVELYETSDVEGTKPVGEIVYDESDHRPTTAINGRLLDMRPTSPPAN